MKKENSTNLQKYSGIAGQMIKMSSDCPEITKFILDIILGKFKDSTGKWIDAIIYERDNHIYMREVTDFIDKFKKA